MYLWPLIALLSQLNVMHVAPLPCRSRELRSAKPTRQFLPSSLMQEQAPRRCERLLLTCLRVLRASLLAAQGELMLHPHLPSACLGGLHEADSQVLLQVLVQHSSDTFVPSWQAPHACPPHAFLAPACRRLTPDCLHVRRVSTCSTSLLHQPVEVPLVLSRLQSPWVLAAPPAGVWATTHLSACHWCLQEAGSPFAFLTGTL